MGFIKTAYEILTNNPPSELIAESKKHFGTRNLNGYLTMWVNATYYKDGFLTEDQRDLIDKGYLRNGRLHGDELCSSRGIFGVRGDGWST